MSLFRNWFASRHVKFHPDSYTLTSDKKYEVMCRWIGELRGRGQRVMVLSHFPSTFLETQSALNDRTQSIFFPTGPLRWSMSPIRENLQRKWDPAAFPKC